MFSSSGVAHPALARAIALCAILCTAGAPADAQLKKPATETAAGTARVATAASRRSRTQNSRFAAEARELTELARALTNETEPGRAYDRLASFTRRHAKEELGARAALALGYYDYNLGRYPQARQWLDMAKPETLLGDYVLYWSAQVDRGLSNLPQAIEELQTLRQEFPQSVLSNLGLQSLADTAVAANQPQVALTALAGAANATEGSSKLLFLRGQAHEQTGDNLAAAFDYLEVEDRYPLSAEADEADAKVKYLEGVLGGSFPTPSIAVRLARASALFDAHDWQDAANAYTELFPVLAADDLETAQLRAADCHVELGAAPNELTALSLQSPENQAARDYYLSEAYWTLNDEADLLEAVNDAIAHHPDSQWTEKTLFLAGNYYWVKLDRDKAASYYQQVVDGFPRSADEINARWRIAWASYMGRRDDAATLIGKFLQDFPDSTYTPDALYWLGRLAERARQRPAARAYFQELRGRFPNSYFGSQARATLRALGRGPLAKIEVLDMIPPLPQAPKLGTQEPVAALPWVQRSAALETIAFDDAAVQELLAAHAATRQPFLELAIARASSNGENYAQAIAAIHAIYPEIEDRPFQAKKRELWLLAYPLPYAREIRSAARRAHIDPMLAAGLIRQESAFAKDARSNRNACGLMQVLPVTGKLLARRLRLRYSDDLLFDPAFNVRLGTVYLDDLLKTYHSPEAALAAYNAGEDRVVAWQTNQSYTELPEFVESIPFTQTREYVQIVMRNATIYRALYGGRR